MSLDLKYNFRQIKDSMKPNLRSGNLVLVIDAVYKHIYYSELTFACNAFFKYGLAIVYFLFTPIINIIVSYAVSEVALLRLFYTLIAINFSIYC
jgi:hypothetical protein